MTAELHAEVAERLATIDRRYTAGRRLLVDALVRAGSPLVLPAILARDPALKQSSVYRNLAALERAGVVRRVLTDEGFGRYELTEDLTGHHHHLVCSNCGAVEDVDLPRRFEDALEAQVDELADRIGFSAVSHRLDLIGLCRRCASVATA